MDEKELDQEVKPKCSNCGSSNVRSRINGDIVCIKCGFITLHNEEDQA